MFNAVHYDSERSRSFFVCKRFHLVNVLKGCSWITFHYHSTPIQSEIRTLLRSLCPWSMSRGFYGSPVIMPCSPLRHPWRFLVKALQVTVQCGFISYMAWTSCVVWSRILSILEAIASAHLGIHIALLVTDSSLKTRISPPCLLSARQPLFMVPLHVLQLVHSVDAYGHFTPKEVLCILPKTPNFWLACPPNIVPVVFWNFQIEISLVQLYWFIVMTSGAFTNSYPLNTMLALHFLIIDGWSDY